jgi:predicted DNA-binding transcriptional regulator AlpA
MKRPDVSELSGFDQLPTSALVRLPIVAALFSISASTVWRWSRTGRLPEPVRVGGVTLWNVGELRKTLSAALGEGNGGTNLD